jgi:tripartite ATP-independent transporter DctP family solute receptor
MKKIVNLFLVLSLFLSLIACGGSSSSGSSASSASQEKVLLRIANNAHSDSSINRALEVWSKTVDEKSNGGLTIQIFPESQLGNNKELSEQVASGSLDMNMTTISNSVNYGIEDGYLAKVPFLFRSYAHVAEFWAGPEGQAIFRKMEDTAGVKILATGLNFYPREFVSKSKPIIHPADLGGIKLRTGDAATAMTMAAIGASPTTVAITEMYTALSNGMLDAVELPVDYIRDYSVYEVAKQLTLSNHLYESNFIVINLRKFNSLPAEYQNLLIEEAPPAIAQNNKEIEESTQQIINDLREKGMTVNQVDHNEWVTKLESVISNMENEWPATKGLYEKILAMP